MKKLSGLFMVLLLAGCAGGPGGGGESSLTQAPVDTEARNRAKLFTDLGSAYFARGQIKVALDEVRKAIQSDNGYGPAYNLLGLIYMELGENVPAEENFRKAVSLGPLDSESHNNYGLFLCMNGRYEDGLARFSQALRNPLYDKPEKAMTNAAICNEKKGDQPQAEAYYNKALKLQPDYAPAIIGLANLKFRAGDLSEVQRLLARHQGLSQPTPASLWLGARLERKLGNRSQEQVYEQQLRKLFPESAEVQLLSRGQYE